jgi:nucleotide-binding universal stress UspA family protein
MGVAGRPGENLFSGDTAASVLEKTPTSVLFLST